MVALRSAEIDWSVRSRQNVKASGELSAQCEKLSVTATSFADSVKNAVESNRRESNSSIRRRISELQKHLELVERTNGNLSGELEALGANLRELRLVRTRLESGMRSNEELRVFRESRSGNERMDDSVTRCLLEENRILRDGRSTFNDLEVEAQGIRKRIENLIEKTSADISNKQRALELDIAQSKKILSDQEVEEWKRTKIEKFFSLHCEYDEWVTSTIHSTRQADQLLVLAHSSRLRFLQQRDECAARCATSHDATSFALRHTIHERTAQCDDLRASHLQLAAARDDCSAAHQRSAETRTAICRPLAVCRARVAQRGAHRPDGVEKCRDEAMGRLVGEEHAARRWKKEVKVVGGVVENHLECVQKRLTEMEKIIKEKEDVRKLEESALDWHSKISVKLTSK